MKKILAPLCFLVSFLIASAASAGPIQVSLTNDSLGGPGTAIDSVLLFGFGEVPSIQSAALASAPTLTAGVNYWVVVTALDPVNNFFGWDRPQTIDPSSPIAPVGQRVGTDPWYFSNDYAGTLRITGLDNIVLFNSFLAGDTYDATSGWSIGGGAYYGNLEERTHDYLPA